MSTLDDLKSELALYTTARDKILGGEEYSIGGFRLRRPQLPYVQTQINRLRIDIGRAEGTGPIVSSPIFVQTR